MAPRIDRLMVLFCALFFFLIQVHADEQNPDMVVFKCAYENKSEIKEIAFYFNSNSPWGYFDNGYYKIC
ncbi:MAG: hypothetical protein CMK56_02490 [Proteobacteria bacterium]|nr:hypothetical protein [Pseudomonadota bacterium]